MNKMTINNNNPHLNAFLSVRPRGVDKPTVATITHRAGRPPALLPGSHVRVLDRNGRLAAPLAPRVGSTAVEGRAAGQASADRRRAILKGGL